MTETIRVGDTVRRKGDTSGRTRVVQELYSGGHIALLDAFLDGWLIWDISKLQLVKRAPQDQPRAKHTPERNTLR